MNERATKFVEERAASFRREETKKPAKKTNPSSNWFA